MSSIVRNLHGFAILRAKYCNTVYNNFGRGCAVSVTARGVRKAVVDCTICISSNEANPGNAGNEK